MLWFFMKNTICNDFRAEILTLFCFFSKANGCLLKFIPYLCISNMTKHKTTFITNKT